MTPLRHIEITVADANEMICRITHEAEMKPQLAVFREILCRVMAEKSVTRKLRWRQVLLEVIDCQKLKIARR